MASLVLVLVARVLTTALPEAWLLRELPFRRGPSLPLGNSPDTLSLIVRPSVRCFLLSRKEEDVVR